MSKIVCDVCGSTYSETEAQCPICGTAKSEAAKPVVETNAEDQAAKGGKFSRSNTRRNGTGSTRRTGAEKNKEEGNPSNVAMIIIVAVLLLAIVSVCVFIAVRLVNRPDQPDPSGSTDSTPPIVQTVPCTGIELVGNPDNALLFTDLTQTAQLNVKAKPENTTDTVTYTYTSSDPSVVTVDASGLVTPVAEGTATVTVAYGSYTITVTVTCELPKPEVKLELVKNDITLRPGSKTFQLYAGELDPADITWTSSESSVASVENGLVTALANGKTVITATYNNQSAQCTVYVKDMDATAYMFAHRWDDDGDEDGESSLEINETLELWFIDSNTKEVIKGVTWTPSNDFPKCCTMENTEKGIKITAIATTYTEEISYNKVVIKVSYEGTEYTYTIRVNKPAETQE
jgi:hypothetical protein